MRALVAFALVALLAVPAIGQDRAPGWGDVGLYGPVGLLDRPLIGSFDLAIVTVSSTQRSIDALPARLERARDKGVAVILDVAFRAKEDGADHPLPGLVETYVARFRDVLDAIDRDLVHAVTLGEENLPWRGGARALTELYHRLKAIYPDVAFYQWYSPTSNRLNVPGDQWPALPADGWIIDHYALAGERYERLVEGWVKLGVPVVNVIWLSPDWKVGRRHKDNTGWWNAEGWKQFHHQLAVSRVHDLPVVFFMFRTPDKAAGENHLKFYGDGSQADADRVMRHTTDVLVPFLRGRPELPLAAPPIRPAWIPAWPPEGD